MPASSTARWTRRQKGIVITSFSNAVVTSTAATTVWTPTATKKFVLLGFQISAVVTNVLAGATPGGGVWLVDSDFTVTATAGPIALVGVVRTATDATATVYNDGSHYVDIPEYTSKAADNVLAIQGSADLGLLRVVECSGKVWGYELP